MYRIVPSPLLSFYPRRPDRGSWYLRLGFHLNKPYPTPLSFSFPFSFFFPPHTVLIIPLSQNFLPFLWADFLSSFDGERSAFLNPWFSNLIVVGVGVRFWVYNFLLYPSIFKGGQDVLELGFWVIFEFSSLFSNIHFKKDPRTLSPNPA